MLHKHIIRNILGFIGIAMALYYSYTKIYDYYSFIEEKTICYEQKKESDDTLRIIMIGDSWAAYHYDYDSLLSNEINKRLTKPVKVVSSGMVGAKTKTIYKLMFNSISDFGTKELIEQRPNYCIISAGINDAVAKMGGKYYSYHYVLMLKQLIANGIKPIIIDMPDVGYESVYKRESLLAKTRHRISSIINQVAMWNFSEYRQALKSKIKEHEFNDRIIYIPASSWNPNGVHEIPIIYQEDQIHLNSKGYQLLDSCIANYILSDSNN